MDPDHVDLLWCLSEATVGLGNQTEAAFIPAERAAELLRLARARHVERQAHYQENDSAAEAVLAAGDGERSAAVLGRWVTARRGVGVQESYVIGALWRS